MAVNGITTPVSALPTVGAGVSAGLGAGPTPALVPAGGAALDPLAAVGALTPGAQPLSGGVIDAQLGPVAGLPAPAAGAAPASGGGCCGSGAPAAAGGPMAAIPPVAGAVAGGPSLVQPGEYSTGALEGDAASASPANPLGGAVDPAVVAALTGSGGGGVEALLAKLLGSSGGGALDRLADGDEDGEASGEESEEGGQQLSDLTAVGDDIVYRASMMGQQAGGYGGGYGGQYGGASAGAQSDGPVEVGGGGPGDPVAEGGDAGAAPAPAEPAPIGEAP